MCYSWLLKVLRELTADGAIILLPVGSDEFLKHIVNEFIKKNDKYDIEKIEKLYSEMLDGEKWFK